jgi:LCP family protein required for cell wall assembly
VPVKTSPRQRVNKNSKKGSAKGTTKSSSATKLRWMLVGLGLTAIALVSATAGALLAFSLSSAPLGQNQLSPQEAAVFEKEKAVSYKNLNIPELSRPVNILILGTKVLTADLGLDNSGQGYQSLVNSLKGLTDTIMLVRFDPSRGKVTLLSIPRDTQVEIEGQGLKKINEANIHGGPALAASTVENLLGGLPIDRYVRVNVQAVEKLIDALGGLSVYVPKDLQYQDDSQHLYINLKKGQQHLNGDQALQLLRYRKDNLGDIGRIQRQQLVARALIEQSLKPQTLLRIPNILSILQSHIDTNLSLEELVAIAGFAAQQERSDVQMLMLPGDFSGNGRNAISYWLPHQDKIRTLMGQYFGLENESWFEGELETFAPKEPSQLRIAIRNGTEDPTRARRLQKHLQESGYSRVYLVDSQQQPLSKTRILAQQGDELSAAQIRQELGVGEVLVESTGEWMSDITIQVGSDW